MGYANPLFTIISLGQANSREETAGQKKMAGTVIRPLDKASCFRRVASLVHLGAAVSRAVDLHSHRQEVSYELSRYGIDNIGTQHAIGKVDCCQDALAGEARVSLQDLLDGFAASHFFQNQLHRNARSCNYRLAHHYGRVRDNPGIVHCASPRWSVRQFSSRRIGAVPGTSFWHNHILSPG